MITDGTILVIGANSFRVTLTRDDEADPPWDREDGHGPVSQWATRAKRPGERVLSKDHRSARYYDYTGAIAIAKRDGWDAPPFGAGTEGERAARAVDADFKRLKDWCADRWEYLGVVVELLNADGDGTGKADSVWGIESDSDKYIDEVARELADQITAADAARMAALAATLGVEWPLPPDPDRKVCCNVCDWDGCAFECKPVSGEPTTSLECPNCGRRDSMADI